MQKALEAAASLKLTVVILSLSMFLTLAGTLAQVDQGVWTVVDQYFRSPMVWVNLQMFVPGDAIRIPISIPIPAGLTLGIALFVNLTAAFIVRFTWSVKRFGIILSHLGIILLLVGEFVTGSAAREGNMSIDEGATANFVEDIRSCELAIIDASGASEDAVTAVPQRVLESRLVEHPLLPCTIEVVEFMKNSTILGPMQATEAQKRRATVGTGLQLAAIRVPDATGVDGQTVDVPSAYVRLRKGSEDLGTYMLSVHLLEPQPVTIDGKEYLLSLRFKRTYKPYSVTLIDFKHDKFLGTDKPRNFSSLVRLRDPERSVDREVLIYMNNPMRYRGETFYQASFKSGDTGTVLQVVENPGWILPYVSCAMVTIGLLAHFGMRMASPVRRKLT
jgi:hypothetical protein